MIEFFMASFGNPKKNFVVQIFTNSFPQMILG